MIPFFLLLLATAQTPVPPKGVYVAPRAIEFGSPVRVPGVTLAAGGYIFVAGRPVAGQMIVDIYRACDLSLAASFLAIETSLLRPGNSAVLDYPGSAPPYIRAWFHRSLRHGYEFVYHPEEARGIFAASGVGVPSAIFRGASTLMGMLPIDHIDGAYRGGRPAGAAEQFAADGIVPDPVDQLTLARMTILAHLPQVAPDIAVRLTLLNAQIADLLESYTDGRDDVRRRLALVVATLDNTAVLEDRELGHVIERVRERMAQFAALLR